MRGEIDSESRWAVEWSWQRAYRWLSRLWRERDWRGAAPDSLLQLLLAAWCCGRFGSQDLSFTLARRAAAALDARPAGASAVSLVEQAHPVFLIMGERLARAAGLPAAALTAAVQLLDSALATMPPAERQSPLILWLRFLLDHLTPAEVPAAVACQLVPAEAVLFLDAGAVEHQCFLWAIVSDCGRARVPEPLREQAQILGEVLPAVMFCCLRQYQLDVACIVLRTMAYLGHDPAAIAEGSAFLAFQQRSNGSFGFLNPLAPGYGQLPADRDVLIHLPLTAAALWTLGELAAPEVALFSRQGPAGQDGVG